MRTRLKITFYFTANTLLLHHADQMVNAVWENNVFRYSRIIQNTNVLGMLAKRRLL
jgi:hypothetical protein